jgi:carbamoyl-phosphate synthase large subunit
VKNKEIQLILNTGATSQTQRDGYEIRRAAIKYKIPYATTTDGTRAILSAIKALKKESLSVKPIQEYHKQNV